MILKGSQRSGAKQLGLHLLRMDENDHVEVHEIRGFVSNNVVNALREAYAVSRGTKCQQYLFSLSLNPPLGENVPIPIFEAAIEETEKRLGLSGQPRVIVFHEKQGRRHAHCVWSRIEPTTLRAVNMSHFKVKLRDMSRQLFLEHGWKMPRGYMNSEEANPLNFSLMEWQQAKRIGRDPQKIKAMFQECWAVSDSLKAFSNALASRGYYLAQGDRRGFVAVDWTGEVYSLSRWTDAKTKDLKTKLGDPGDLSTVAEASEAIAIKVASKLTGFSADVRLEFDAARLALKARRDDLVVRQRNERAFLAEVQAARWVEESRYRNERFRKGLGGLWDLVTGKSRSIRAENAADIVAKKARDQAERQVVIDRQLSDRRMLQSQVKSLQNRHEREAERLQVEMSGLPQFRQADGSSPDQLRPQRQPSPSL